MYRYVFAKERPRLGSNRTKRKPALPSLYIEETKVVTSNTNLERDEIIESVDTESADELWIQIENAICEKTRTHGRRFRCISQCFGPMEIMVS
jgi:hypothetical protein